MRRVTEPIILAQTALFLAAAAFYGMHPLVAWAFAATVVVEAGLGLMRIGGR